MSSYSIAGDKIAFLAYEGRGRGRWYEDLWVVNTDGTGEKVLVETNHPDSPFFNREIWGNVRLSPDGGKVIFLTGITERKSDKNRITVWRMNTDGKEIQKKTVDFPLNYSDFRLVAWPVYKGDLLFFVEDKSLRFGRIPDRLVWLDLESLKYQVLFDDVKAVPNKDMYVCPKQNFIVLVTGDRSINNDKLVLLDMKTLQHRVIFEADKMKLWTLKWSPDGEKFLFSRANETYIYFPSDDKIEKVGRRNYGCEIGLDWLLDGKRFVFINPVDGEYYLSVVGEDLKEKRKIKIPYPVERQVHVWGLENKVLFHLNRRLLVRFDLETGKWKKIY
ncbi:MAG: hypothetical protein JXB26_13105 [Candidatus Aminicenantes bacterium]|nr:hypothetical protein [Candidatus Aminicenantes bacterium]